MSQPERRSPDQAPRDLRARREAAGMSLRWMAARSGYSTSYLSRVENGRKAVTPAVARLYADMALHADQTGKVHHTRRFPAPHAAVTREPGLETLWFGSEVRRLRISAGKSLRVLGGEVYLSRAQLGKIEQGDARGSYQLALSLDDVLRADGRLAKLFLEECAHAGPVAPDVGILDRAHLRHGVRRGADPAEVAADATARLEVLRVRSHEVGPLSVLQELGEGVTELHAWASGSPQGRENLIWRAKLRYAELLSWTAQETGHDAVSLRWTRLAADWARCLSDSEATAYLLIRLSQRARRRGDAATAISYAQRAGLIPGISARIALFAAQREAQAQALSRDEAGFRRSLDRYQALLPASLADQTPPDLIWGPHRDATYERCRILEATCLVDLADYHTAADLFDQDMGSLVLAHTGYARIALREAIAYASIGEPEHACFVTRASLPTLARQGSASLRSDLRHLARALNRYRHVAAVSHLLPDLASCRAYGGRSGNRRRPIANLSPAMASRPDRPSKSPKTQE